MSWQVPGGFTCTGLGWDGTNLLIGDFTSSRIVKTDVDGNLISAITLGGSPPANSVQGVAWDTLRSHYWVAHYATGGGSLRRYDATGALQQTIDLSGVGVNGPNGISYDAANDQILTNWDNGTMRGIGCVSETVDEGPITLGAFGASDGIEIDPADSTVIWISTDTVPCVVAEITRATGAVVSQWTAPKSVEDIAFVGSDFYMAVDQGFHDSIAGGNRIWKMDPATGLEITTGFTNALMAMWSLDEASGARVDLYGGNNLADINTVTQAAGVVGNAALFTRANSERLTIADNARLSMGDIPFTILTLAYIQAKPASGSLTILSKHNNTTSNREYAIDWAFTPDKFRFLVSSDGSTGTTLEAAALGSPSTGTWYPIIVKHDPDANTITIKIHNGTEWKSNSTAHSGGVFNGNSDFALGALTLSTPVNHWDGRTDQTLVLKRLTTDVEDDWFAAGRTYAEVLAGMPLASAQPINFSRSKYFHYND